MLADYDFYHDTYKGIVFTDANSYGYFGERASDELALYSNNPVFQNETANNQLKKCACRIAEILFSVNGGKVGQQTVSSESISGYYSVTYKPKTEAEIESQIKTAIKLYIGRYILRPVKVVW